MARRAAIRPSCGLLIDGIQVNLPRMKQGSTHVQRADAGSQRVPGPCYHPLQVPSSHCWDQHPTSGMLYSTRAAFTSPDCLAHPARTEAAIAVSWDASTGTCRLQWTNLLLLDGARVSSKITGLGQAAAIGLASPFTPQTLISTVHPRSPAELECVLTL